MRSVASSIGSRASVARHARSIQSLAEAPWHRSQTKCPRTHAAVELELSWQRAQVRSVAVLEYSRSERHTRHPVQGSVMRGEVSRSTRLGASHALALGR